MRIFKGRVCSAFGVSILLGKLNIPGKGFGALVVLADSCGNIITSAAIDIPDSWQEQYWGMLELGGGDVMLVGDCLFDSINVGLISRFNRHGAYIGSEVWQWNEHITFNAVSRLSFGRSVYVGYTRILEGLNYYDAFVAVFDGSDKPLWAKKYSTVSQDRALAVAELATGLLVVGLQNIGMDGFILLLSFSGDVISQVSIPRGILRDVKAMSGGGFIAVGEYKHADGMADGLIVLGHDNGRISKLFRFKHVVDSVHSLIIRTVMELTSTTFVILGHSSGLGRARTVLAVVDINEDSIRHAYYLGEDGPSMRTYGERVLKSVQGGYTVAGHRRTQFSTYDFFLAELTEDFELPGIGSFMEMVDNEFILEKLNVEQYTGSLNFAVSDVSGFKSTALPQSVYNQVSVSVNTLSLLNNCIVKPITPIPSLQPTYAVPTYVPTLIPSTAIPSAQPTVRPSARPTTARPSNAPVTSRPTEFGETNPPTVDPTEYPTGQPSMNPTLKPTPAPSFKPSIAPTMQPSTLYPTLNPTMNPSTKPATSFPSTEPLTLAPTWSPSSRTITGRPTVTDGDPSGSIAQDNSIIVGSISTFSVLVFAICCSLCYYAYKNFSFRVRRGRSGEMLRRSGRNKDPTQYVDMHRQLHASYSTADFRESYVCDLSDKRNVADSTDRMSSQKNGHTVEPYQIDAASAEFNSQVTSIDEFYPSEDVNSKHETVDPENVDAIDRDRYVNITDKCDNGHNRAVSTGPITAADNGILQIYDSDNVQETSKLCIANESSLDVELSQLNDSAVHHTIGQCRDSTTDTCTKLCDDNNHMASTVVDEEYDRQFESISERSDESDWSLPPGLADGLEFDVEYIYAVSTGRDANL
jgi:hypothetical protein